VKAIAQVQSLEVGKAGLPPLLLGPLEFLGPNIELSPHNQEVTF
jgi:hypothetical protein